MLKRMNMRGKIPKIGIISLAMVVASTSMGVGYACFTYGWPFSFGSKTTCVQTEPCDCKFGWAVSNDDGHQTTIGSTVIDPGDNNIGETYDKWPGTSSRDPSGPPPACGQEAPRYDKDVARTTASVNGDPHIINILLENAYPLYNPAVCFAIKCPDARATITKITVDENADTDAIDDIPELTVPPPTGIYVGQEINPGEEAVGSLQIRVEQPAQQNATYKIKVLIETSCYTETCGTGYAYGGCKAICFLSIPNRDSNNWGWTNGPFSVSQSLSYTNSNRWPIYVGAAKCDRSKGELVGYLTVTYNKSTRKLSVTYDMKDGYTMDEVQLWVGNTMLPLKNRTTYSTAPGQFNYKATLNNAETYTFPEITINSRWSSFYIAAHTEVCWFK
ncbi:MAG: hypothetical protein ABIH70_06280 [Chloroflexota bacterium]